MDPETVTQIAETLAGYLAGERVGDFKTQETFRQLAQRVLTPLSPNEAALLRQAPVAHRMLLFGALSEALRSDPVARQLAAHLCAPEPTQQPPRMVQEPRSSGGFHVNIRGNGNAVGDGNVIGPISLPHTAGPPRKEPTARRIRILFLSANPVETATLHSDWEARDIQAALQRSELRDQFDLRQELAVRVGDLQRCLLQHRPDILHFSGHGEEGSILLENRDGETVALSGSDLAHLLAILKDRTRCVVLNACYSATAAGSVAHVIDSVIARPETINDHAAILFSNYFYQALAFGRSVRQAFDLSCLQLRMEGWSDQTHPVLLATRCNPEEIRFAGES